MGGRYYCVFSSVGTTEVRYDVIGEQEPLVAIIQQDLSHAHVREAEERTKRIEVEKELEELKKKFAPFLNTINEEDK